MEALFFLVDTVQNFGLFRDHTHRAAIVRIVLERFSKEIENFSTTPECPGATQYLWDLFFLRTICEDWGDVMDEAISSLNNSIKSIQEVIGIPSDYVLWVTMILRIRYRNYRRKFGTHIQLYRKTSKIAPL